MTTWIALIRGVNVVGKNPLPMKALVAHLQLIGCDRVATYIQSGNVVFKSRATSSNALAKKIATTIQQHHGFLPSVMLLTDKQLQVVIDANPFPEAAAKPNTLHVFFLAAAPNSHDLTAVSMMAARSERFRLTNQVFYLHAPGGFGQSKLAKSIERHLGVAATARNWRTVLKLREMSTEI